MTLEEVGSYGAIYLGGLLSHPAWRLVSRTTFFFTQLLLLLDLAKRYPKATRWIGTAILILTVLAGTTGCSVREIEREAIVTNVESVGVFGPSYCEDELEAFRRAYRTELSCRNLKDKIFGFNLEEARCSTAKLKAESYKHCVNEHKANTVLVNPFNGVR